MGALLTPVSSLREHSGSRILVVEDEFIVARDIQRRLEILGYVVVGCVATGEEAVARVRDLKPDLALIDISLRGKMDGIEAARRIHDTADVAIVFATANSDLETFDRAREASPSGFVLKPFDEREVGIIIDAALFRHTAMRSLHESEQRYRALFESLGEGLYLLTDVVLECNQQLCRLLDLAKSDIVGKTIAELSPELQSSGAHSARDSAERARLALEGTQQSFAWDFRKGRGGVVSVTVALQALNFGERRVLQGNVRPIRPPARYESGELSAIVESSDDAIFSKTLDGTILSWNAGAERLYGYGADEIIGKSVSVLLPDGRKEEIQDILDRLKRGEHVDHFETTRLCKGGREVHVSVTVSPVKDPAGKIVAASTIARDITQWRKSLEERDAALKEKELLLHEIHHRTKNNLQIVSSLLSLQAKSSTNKEVELLVRQSQDRLNAMAMIHARLIQSNEVTHVEFREYIEGLVSDLARSYGTDAVGVRVEADRTELSADTAVSCGLIINELVTNAFKYAFPGGRKGEVVVRFRNLGEGRHALSVSDTGIGIKVNNGGQPARSLGFQLVDTLTEQIGGRLEMDCKDGTSFVVWFES